jgi:alpha-mannosidase
MKKYLWTGLILAALLAATVALAKEGKEQKGAPAWPVKYYRSYLRHHHLRPEDLRNQSVGNSHIDAAWLWRVPETHKKVYNTFSAAVTHMDQFPGFTFAGSSSQYYEWMLEDHPELFARIVELEKQGRFELVGGTWVEADGNMPDGESYSRQFLLGQRFYLEHFGHIATICWMPDTFGYNRNLPQLIARAGGKYMWGEKLSWNDTTVFPFHNFHWQSPDGSQVIMTMTTDTRWPKVFPYGELGRFHDTRYLAPAGKPVVANYTVPYPQIQAALSKDWLNEVVILFGVGDGGAGPQEREIQSQQTLVDKGWTKWSTTGKFFEDLEKVSDRLPTWDEELYFEYHRGVLTTHAEVKAATRRSEQVMRTAETLRAAVSSYGIAYPYSALKSLWKLVLLNHFHDILPGSSIPEVYEDAAKDFAKIEEGALSATRDGLQALAKLVKIESPAANAEPVLVFNSLGWSRPGLVRLPVPAGKSYQVLNQAGKPLVSQAESRDSQSFLCFRAEAVPAVGYQVYYLKPGPAPAASGGSGLSITDSGGEILLENDLVQVRVDKAEGLLRSVKDKASGKELIAAGSNKLLAFYDRDIKYRAWNINPNYLQKPIMVPAPAEVKITSQGPLWVEAMVSRRMTKDGKATTFEQRVRLLRGDPVVYLDLDSDFHIENSLVKLEFNTTLKSNTVAADGPYLVLERPTHPVTPAEKARWEMPCQKWIDLAEPGIGLALLNRGKYGFSLNPDSTGYRLSVIKGAEYPRARSTSENVAHYKHKQLPYTDQGSHHIELGLLAHPGTWREAKLWRAGYEFNTPLEAAATEPHSGSLPAESSLVSVEAETTYLGALKRAEDDDDLVLRLVEAAGKKGPATVKFGPGRKVVSAAETDLIELHPRPLDASGSSVTIEMGPYQVRTLKVKLAK